MKTFTAGEFTLEIGDPWPMWVVIKTDRYELRSFKHSDLVDLKHVIERAIAEASRRCPGETA